MLGSATEDAVLRGFIKPSDSQAAQAASDSIVDARMKRLSSKRAATVLSRKSPIAASNTSKVHSHTLLALPPPESPTQSQRLALMMSTSSTPTKTHQSLPLAIPGSRSHSSRSGSLLEGALAIPFQSPLQNQAVRYQNQLMATRPWLQAVVEKKEAGSDKDLYRTRSLPAVHPPMQQAKKKVLPRKKSKPRNERQQAGKSGWAKKQNTEDLDAGGLGSMWLDFAEDEIPEIDIQDPKQTQDILVPESVKRLNYWQALGYFQAHDTKKKGFLNKDQFWLLIDAVCRDQEHVTKQRAFAIYDDIDIDESGSMEKDEFMGWAFQTHNNYLAAVRTRLETMHPREVHEMFLRIDSNNNGLIDKDEFWVFVDKFSPNSMTRQASDELHGFIDADSSGEINLDEFLNWVHPGRELKLLMGDSDVGRPLYEVSKKEVPLNQSMLPTGLSALGTRASEENNFMKPDKPMMESEPGKPVVLEFTIGRTFMGSMQAITKALRNVFGPNQVKFDIQLTTTSADSCNKVEAKVGRGIVLWERDRMIQHTEDPFESIKSAEMWIKDVLAECLPDVVGAANLRFQKRIRRNKCWVCSKSLNGITPIMIESVPVCGKDCGVAYRKQLHGVFEIEARVQRQKRQALRAAEGTTGSSGTDTTS